ncbi:hypothetical protein Tco_1381628 [Tanacetum coccineum]
MDKPPLSSPLSFPPKKGHCHVGNLTFLHNFCRINGCDQLKEAQGLWMAWIRILKSLTEEKHLAKAEDIAYSINRVLVIAEKE